MTLKNRLAGLYLTVGKRLFGVGKEEVGMQVAMMNGANHSREYVDTYRGIVYRAISAVSEAVGKYEPLLQRQNGKNFDRVVSHPFLDLLYRPNKHISQNDLFTVSQTFDELLGEFFWYTPLGQLTNRPKEIYILHPNRMMVNIDENGEVIGYSMRKGDGTKIGFLPEEILHHKEFNPKNPYRGYGTVEAAIDYISTEDSTAKFTRNFFENNAGINGVLTLKGQVSKEAFKKFALEWRAKYEGVDSAGKTAILRDMDTSFTKVGLGLDEVDMASLRKMTIDELLMMFRVPKGILGLSDETGLGRASVETLEYIFSKYTVEQKMTKIDSTLQRFLDLHYPKDRLFITHENTVPSDKVFELEQRKAAVDIWMTRNEVRKIDGLETIDGGDDLRSPITQVPLSYNSDDADAGSSKALKRISLVAPKKKDNSPEVTYDQKENFRLSLQKNQEAYERLYKRALKPLISKQNRSVLETVDTLANKKDLTSQLFDLSEAVEDFDQKLYPVLADMYAVQGALALTFAGADESVEFTVNESVAGFIHTSTRRMAQRFNEETLEQLSRSLAEGINAGESVQKLKARVESIYTEVRGYRSERIARTETLKASNNATNFAYKQSGFVKEKEWFANPGACEFCNAMNGKIFGLSDSFSQIGQEIEGEDGGLMAVSYENIENPPLHPNCRCTILPVR